MDVIGVQSSLRKTCQNQRTIQILLIVKLCSLSVNTWHPRLKLQHGTFFNMPLQVQDIFVGFFTRCLYVFDSSHESFNLVYQRATSRLHTYVQETLLRQKWKLVREQKNICVFRQFFKHFKKLAWFFFYSQI